MGPPQAPPRKSGLPCDRGLPAAGLPRAPLRRQPALCGVATSFGVPEISKDFSHAGSGVPEISQSLRRSPPITPQTWTGLCCDGEWAQGASSRGASRGVRGGEDLDSGSPSAGTAVLQVVLASVASGVLALGTAFCSSFSAKAAANSAPRKARARRTRRRRSELSASSPSASGLTESALSRACERPRPGSAGAEASASSRRASWAALTSSMKAAAASRPPAARLRRTKKRSSSWSEAERPPVASGTSSPWLTQRESRIDCGKPFFRPAAHSPPSTAIESSFA
mmetsp:Transcript_822/g.2612  ORF Transcript_822/g.2612 Transcript_822/m.2612 type:complete len:282 (-) Transcript_822:304-1149(-)